MKNINKFLLVLLFSFGIAFIGCEDRSDINVPPLNTGDADFSRFVVVGNSLSAAYQNGTLYESSQKYSYGKLIADQVGTDFAQPYYSDPGAGGRLEIASFNADGTPNIVPNPNKGVPTNLEYQAPYNNLGIPGEWLADALFATDSNTCVTGQNGKPNPYFDLVLRGIGTQLQQAKMLHPTFVIFWLGNNDILGYAAYGGTVAHNDVNTFTALYSMALDTLATTGAKVVVANIPYVTATPYFTTIGPKVGLAIKDAVDAGLAVGVYYQKNGEIGPVPQTQFVDYNGLFNLDVILTLGGSKYAALIGQPTGKFYRDHGIADPSVLGIDTTKPFGLHPLNPYPDALTLDADELAEIKTTIDGFNNAIATLAAAHNYPVVDINAFMNQVAANGYDANGIHFTSAYITGNTFSLDGVHPTSRGYAVVANLFIDKINEAFNAEIPKIDVATVPNSILLQGSAPVIKNGIPQVDESVMRKVLY